MKLEVKDLSCGYDGAEPVQRYINFSVASGEVCCILGPNGCGKTTLFKTILGLLPPRAGVVMIDGENVAKWGPKRLAQNVAYASQNHVPPFPYRVKDVVLLGRVNSTGMQQPTDNDYYIVDSAMRDMGVYELRDEVYTDISGGQLQLVMIARALAQQPKLLVLDEPTAALDYGNAIRVISKVRWLAKQGYAVLMTTHSPDHAFMCHSNVVLLQRNKPMHFGSAREVVTERNMRQAYGIDVRVVEFVNKKGEIMRMCAPEIDEFAEEEEDAAGAGDAPEAPAAGAKGEPAAGEGGAPEAPAASTETPAASPEAPEAPKPANPKAPKEKEQASE